MKLDTYESAVDSSKFVTVPAGTDLERVGLPYERSLLHLNLVRAGYEVPEPHGDGVLVRSIRAQIADKGYAVHGFALFLYERPSKR